MAALKGTLQGNRKSISRCGDRISGIGSNLNTWNGRIITTLEADGDFSVMLESFHHFGEDSYPQRIIIEGNVNDGAITRSSPINRKED